MPLSIVLHSHMPYVEGFGTWPFGEEWLLEAMAAVYVPLLDVLDDRVNLGVTPVLADQLEAPGLDDRFRTFCRELRVASHALDAAEHPDAAPELTRAARDYARAADRLDALPGDLSAALFDRPGVLAGAATHAVLPLCATGAGVDLQVCVGVAAHRARLARAGAEAAARGAARWGGAEAAPAPRGAARWAGAEAAPAARGAARWAGAEPAAAARGATTWDGGFWLPECAYAPWLDEHLAAAGVRYTFVDLTDVSHDRRPRDTPSGVTLVPIDRWALELVWARDGYPSGGAYRAYHRRSARDHHPWAVDGATYDPDRAREQAVADAADFARRIAERTADGSWSVVAMDTELLGHWWYEGPWWLQEVLVALDREGVEVLLAADALARTDHIPVEDELPPTTWGTPRDLSTWDRPGPVADLAWQARTAELELLGADAPPRALRELLALQSSDWAFLETNQLSGPYPFERAAGHRAEITEAVRLGSSSEPALRNLAPFATDLRL